MIFSGKRVSAISGAIALLLLCIVSPSCSNTADELSGSTWILTYDPDSPTTPPDDMMVFKKKNKVDLRDSQSVYLTCDYKLSDEEVILECNVRGETKQMVLKFSNGRTVLKNPSEAEYTKQ